MSRIFLDRRDELTASWEVRGFTEVAVGHVPLIINRVRLQDCASHQQAPPIVVPDRDRHETAHAAGSREDELPYPPPAAVALLLVGLPLRPEEGEEAVLDPLLLVPLQRVTAQPLRSEILKDEERAPLPLGGHVTKAVLIGQVVRPDAVQVGGDLLRLGGPLTATGQEDPHPGLLPV